MNVTLTPELERIIEEKVSTGRYQSATDVIRAGLKLLEEQDRPKPSFMVSSIEELHEKLDEGIESLRRGEYGTRTAEEIITEAREQLRKSRNG
jgi:antitoxin ParD1/3/4